MADTIADRTADSADAMTTWLITGASSGIGAALARAALFAGHNVAAAARDAARVAALAEAFPDHVLPLALDLARPEQILAAVQTTHQRFGAIDVLVNSAGVAYYGAVEEGEDAVIRALFEVNVFGLGAMLRAALPGMRARGQGKIVNISSASGMIGFPALGYYSASKFAVEGLSEALSQEVGPLGIEVMVAELGTFRTGIIARSPRAPRTPGCAPAAHRMMAMLEGGDAFAPGDPDRAAAVLLRIVEAGAMPRRLILGSDCLSAVIDKLDATKADCERWAPVSKSTDFASG